jgi:tRNA 2-thiouridine synthesizing protein D
MSDSPLRYAIQISHAPTQSGLVRLAHRFVCEALDTGHRIERLFFFGEGVGNAFVKADPQEIMTLCDWGVLAHDRSVDLVFCSTAAMRRGWTVHREGRVALRTPLPGFRPGGLGLWVEASLAADRLIHFGG